MTRRLMSYKHARRLIETGDVLLRRPTNPFGWATAVVGRGDKEHGSLAGWWIDPLDSSRDHLMSVEMSMTGGRAVYLSNVVKRYPGKIDVYKPVGPLDEETRLKILSKMIDYTATPYGWRGLWNAVKLRLPFLRWFRRADTNDAAAGYKAKFCTDAISRSYRENGIDPVPNLADHCTEPDDLDRSSCFKYFCTLVAD